MAIGAQPTQTSVVVSDGSGQSATIDAATDKAAGVMTAVMYRQLQDLLRWRVGVETGGDAEGGVDIITRGELNAVLQSLRAQPAAIGNQFDQRRLLARVDALEAAQTQALSLPAPQTVAPTFDAGAVSREEVDQIKADIASMTARVAQLEQFANTLIDSLPQQLNTAHATADPSGAYASLASRVSRVEEVVRVIVEESIATAQAQGAA